MQKARVKGNWGTNAVITDKGEIVEPRMLGEGLRPSAVTRDLKWGVEVPTVGNKDEDEAMEGKVICEFSNALDARLLLMVIFRRLGQSFVFVCGI